MEAQLTNTCHSYICRLGFDHIGKVGSLGSDAAVIKPALVDGVTEYVPYGADVATGFKAPYADTADYATSAPASDSARVAGNSYLLQTKDTTALWNAKTLQGKDTTALWNSKTLQGKDTTALWNAKRLQGKDTTGFVRAGQVDAVTSAMIVPNTIVRADVAVSFKAPYADTADYATSAPASDSARVAGNSYLLQTKDTTALWNAKRLQGKDTTGFVRTGQTNSITSGMIADGEVQSADIADANITGVKIAAGAVDSGKIADGSVTGADIKNGTITTADIAASGVTAGTYGDGYHVARITVDSAGRLTSASDTTILGASPTGPAGGDLTGNYPNPTIAADKVTSAKILNGSILRADVANNFKAPYADTADYATSAPASDSARVAGNSYLLQTKDTTALWNAKTLQGKDTTALWNSKTLQGKDTTALWNAKRLQGKDTTGFVRTGQVDAVTSAMIVPNTIVRADVAVSFKAPYADTADYATSAPASDSARVAGNSYLLQTKDTTALWNAKRLQGKDTTGFVRTGQADAVTSAMIVPNTIVRADVAVSFKAPYADTADYATSAPASDSARVAGNSYLLQTKDTTALWNAKTLQGKDTTALWNSKTLQGKDTAALWNAKRLQGKDTTGFVRTGQVDAVTSAMIVPNTIVRADVAVSFKAPYADTADYATSAPASDSARVAGNSYLLQTKDTTALWNAKTLQGKDTTALWNSKTLQGKDTIALWNAKTLQGKDTIGFVRTGQVDAVTSAMIVPNTIVRADVANNFKAPYADTADYATSAPASDSARVAGNSYLLLGKDTTALWNSKTLQGKDTTALWNAKTLQGKDTTGFVRTGQANSVTSLMIADNNVTLSKTERGTSSDSGKAIVSLGSGVNPVWGYPAAIGNTSPTTMQSLRFGTVSVDFPSTSGPAFVETTATITGAAVGDLIFVTSTSGFNANFILCATCEVTSANTIRVRAYLPGSSTIDPDADSMRYVLIKP